jgi:hypothetical protein
MRVSFWYFWLMSTRSPTKPSWAYISFNTMNLCLFSHFTRFPPISQGYSKGFFGILGPTRNFNFLCPRCAAPRPVYNEPSRARLPFRMTKLCPFSHFSRFSQGYSKGFFGILGPTRNFNFFCPRRAAPRPVYNEPSRARLPFRMTKLCPFSHFSRFNQGCITRDFRGFLSSPGAVIPLAYAAPRGSSMQHRCYWRLTQPTSAPGRQAECHACASWWNH